jgi:PAS domain S-box-containing protein
MGTTISIGEARQQLHETLRTDRPFDEKARTALELGRQYLGADGGLLVRIDRENNHWEPVITTDIAAESFSFSHDPDLGETYCGETIDHNTPFVLHDAANQGWADDPAFEFCEFHTYLGVPLILNENAYGTVCFVAKEPRSEPFDNAATWFAEHLARLLERELERKHVEAELTNQTNLATVLNRVLRHNLRNDISVIRGYTELMAEQLDDEPVAETVLAHIDDLIKLSQKARELEEVISASSERQYTEITSLVENIVGTISDEYPSSSISVEYDGEIRIGVLRNFDRAIEELVENAVKHSGDSPRVTISIETVANGVEIRISDDGPGLPDHEAKVLADGKETPLAHGTGLGLWLAYWIIMNHDGSLDSTVTNDGTTMTISVPEKPTVGAQQQLTELTRSRDKYKAAFQEANEAIVIVDDNGRIMDANPATSTVFGLDHQKLMGRPIAEFLSDDFEFKTEWRELLETGGERDIAPVLGIDGVDRVLEYSATADIIPGQHLFVGRDVTEQEKRRQDSRS